MNPGGEGRRGATMSTRGSKHTGKTKLNTKLRGQTGEEPGEKAGRGGGDRRKRSESETFGSDSDRIDEDSRRLLLPPQRL